VAKKSAATSTTATTAGPAEKTVWLCRPGLANNPCTGDLTSTLIASDGSTKVQHAAAAKDPKIDCFYVYPTVSSQPGPNADLTIDPEERAVASQQAARFSQDCRVFAPMYRQVTLSAILNQSLDQKAIQALAYQDVLTAWQEYLRDDNHGRGVVFLSHSQGSFMLIKLLAEQVDPSAAERKLLVSAILIGGNVRVPVGKTVGGDFQHIPTCQSDTQTGCLIAYSSYPGPPPSNAIFGHASRTGLPADAPPMEVACTNPAALGGGSADLDSFLEPASMPGSVGAMGPTILGGANVASLAKATTPWAQWQGRYQAQCQNSGGVNVLVVQPKDPSAPVLTADPPGWGTHIVDVNLALGNLVDDVRTETAHYPG
jgi:hypothetical protein